MCDLLGISFVQLRKLLDGEMPRPRGRPCALTPDTKERLRRMLHSGLYYRDSQFAADANKASSNYIDRQTVRRLFTADIPTKFRKRKPAEANKYTIDSFIRMHEYREEQSLVPRVRLRFYDQTGASLEKLMTVARREDPTREPPDVPKLSQGANKHFSFFGLTSLDTSLPALVWKVYPAEKENKQNGETHVDFFLSMAEQGLLRKHDVIVMDGWRAHTGDLGQKLERFMYAKYKIIFLVLAPRMSHQNPIEHVWRIAKDAARRKLQEEMAWEYYQVPELIGTALNNVNHIDILRLMIGDRYDVERGLIKHLCKTYNISKKLFI